MGSGEIFATLIISAYGKYLATTTDPLKLDFNIKNETSETITIHSNSFSFLNNFNIHPDQIYLLTHGLSCLIDLFIF
jgi:hypothetical protein